MKSKISNAHSAIVQDTFERWENNVYAGVPNIEKAKTYIRAAYKNGIGAHRSTKHKLKDVKFLTVASPVAFMLAVTVVRGRMSKKWATEICGLLGIDPEFLKDLRRDPLAKWNGGNRRWWHNANSEFGRTWLRAIRAEYLTHERLVSRTTGLVSTTFRSRFSADSENAAVAYNTNSLDNVMRTVVSLLNDHNALESKTTLQRNWEGKEQPVTTTVTSKQLGQISSAALWDNNITLSAIGELRKAIDIEDVVRNADNAVARGGDAIFLGNIPKAIDAEILSRILKIDDPELTWEHEVFHHCTAFAAFQSSCIILADRPTMHTNEAGNLHNTTGPAVSWTDGTRLWFNDGHYMEEGGRYIVDTPNKLTTEHILRINNEETRRLAIEQFGWDKFIVEADCPVLDRRTNDIDNTIEMLVGAPRSQSSADDVRWSRPQQNRMVLFCRSTGRRYFLSVPSTVQTCSDAQAWMANDGTDSDTRAIVAYASKPMRLLGAS
jgi:hypothetical protein